MTGGWRYWIDQPPPSDEIVECRRVTRANVKQNTTRSFWVKPSLMAPEWNIANVIWRTATNGNERKQTNQT